MGRRVGHARSSVPSSRHLRWESFEARISKGPPSVEPIAGAPRINLFIEPGGGRIGARFYCKRGQVVPSPLAEVTIREVGIGAETCLEISVGNSSLFRDFYLLCCQIANRVQLSKRPVGIAIKDTLAAWSSLIRRKTLLSHERQIGLLGELLFMRRVAKSVGWKTAAHSWFGPNPEEHDFVLPAADAEVKTTTREQRIHLISSVTQLLPKEGRRLQFVSIQLTAGGENKDAFSLSETIASVLLAAGQSSSGSADAIRDQLRRYGWNDEDAPLYGARYYLRLPIRTVQVDKDFPAIFPSTIELLGPEKASRIADLSYSISVEGLGSEDGSEFFEHALFRKRGRR